ncbi:FUSC family protein [Corynebacterium uberis]
MPMEKMSTLVRLRGLDSSLKARYRRVRKRAFPIAQAAIAAGLSLWGAQELFGHRVPFFAPISAVIILGLSGGDRMKRALEMSFGCVLGVGLGDLIVPELGAGAWQITVAVCASLLVASFVSSSPLVNNQVAIGSILLATIMPPGGASPTGAAGPDRMIDAIIGSVVGLLVIAVMPNNPLNQGRLEVSKILGIVSSVLQDVSDALRAGDAKTLREALHAVRGTQGDINAMLAAARGGREAATISPLMWGSRRKVRTLERLLAPVDNSIRNTRVLARRAMVMGEDGDRVSDEQIAIIDELSDITLAMSELYAKGREGSEAAEIPELVNRLRQLGARMVPEVAEGRVLSAYSILAQSRSLLVDLLRVCGMSRESALAVLAPTSATPAYPPEVWDMGED